MKKLKAFLPIGLVIFSLIAFSFQQVTLLELPDLAPQDTSSNYLDGLYTGHSRSIYSSEPYWGHVRIEIANGTFTDIFFVIRDSSRHENVDSLYGINHYASNPAYQQQCVNDGHGIEIYPQQLLESQNLDNIDCISGATWSHNIFIASVITSIPSFAATATWYLSRSKWGVYAPIQRRTNRSKEASAASNW